MTLLANQIIHTGEFPSQLKIARVKPLYKKDDQSSFLNYRPIYLLPSISKIFENVMAAQLMDYFTTNNLFCIQQFGFRPRHSTELAALKLENHLIAEIDNCEIPTNISIDLSKAFDTLNCDILLKKLDHYGIDESAKRLIHSYLYYYYCIIMYTVDTIKWTFEGLSTPHHIKNKFVLVLVSCLDVYLHNLLK